MANKKAVHAVGETHIEESPSFTKVLETGGKALAVAVGFLYVSGLLMVNLYLLQFGASDFSILRTRYVLSGFIVFVTFLVLSASGLYSGYSDATGHEIITVRSLLTGLPIYAYGALQVFFPLPGSTEHHGWWATYSPTLIKPFPIVLLSAAISMSIIYWRKKPQSERRLMPLFGIGGLILVAYTAAIPFAAYGVYPRIPAQFGGGRSFRARLALAKDSKTQLISLGLNASPDSELSFPVDVIHEGEDFFVLRTNTSTVQVERKAIVGLWVQELFSGRSPAPELHLRPGQSDKEVKEEMKRERKLADIFENPGTGWEFVELSRWGSCVFDLQKDPEKQRDQAIKLFSEIMPAPENPVQCREACEKLTTKFYEVCKKASASSVQNGDNATDKIASQK
jgi:hypothetical protein